MTPIPASAAEALIHQVRALKEQLVVLATSADAIERQLVQAAAPAEPQSGRRGRPGRNGQPYLNGDTGHGHE